MMTLGVFSQLPVAQHEKGKCCHSFCFPLRILPGSVPYVLASCPSAFPTEPRIHLLTLTGAGHRDSVISHSHKSLPLVWQRLAKKLLGRSKLKWKLVMVVCFSASRRWPVRIFQGDLTILKPKEWVVTY